MPARDLLLDVALPVPLAQTFTYRWPAPPDAGETPPTAGDLVVVPFGRRRELVGLVVAVRRRGDGDGEEPAGLRDVRRLLPPAYRLEGDRWRLAGWLADYYALPLGEVVPLFHPPAPGTRARGRRREEAAYPLADAEGLPVLTAAQEECVEAALALLGRRSYGAMLVHGVTGSGKTEVFLRVIAAALAEGRGAIYLLPEIALTPQTLARITARFGGAAAAIHSGLSAGERCRVHEAAAAGDVRVVVGPRSALFAPVRDLGVVVVDEEHETSYKQDEKPRYHARHAALVRAREADAVALLGSATPDLESYQNGLCGRYRLAVLPERVIGELPRAEVVDMRGAAVAEGFSSVLNDALAGILDAGRQAILYYNRRGFARALQCRACGEVESCPRCDIGLTVHLRPRRLLCHYCGFTRTMPAGCSACGGAEFLTSGGGTEKVELALAAAFPAARLLRLDQDTTRRRGSHGRILSAFAAHEADILLGTQMVAMGHHFPGVGLVGVLAADDGLTLPDFRAAERVFQLLTQVAGRTGRDRPGRVIFQTWRPEDPVITAAAEHDYGAFVAQELQARRALGYPPYRRLLRVGVSARRRRVAEEAAASLARAIRNALAGGEREVLGPAPAVFERLQDRQRMQILVKGSLSTEEKRWLATCSQTLRERERGLEIVLDFDPQGLY
jgi:primosomal protein N' (replication factor Y)